MASKPIKADLYLPEARKTDGYGKLIAVFAPVADVRELWFEQNDIVRVVRIAFPKQVLEEVFIISKKGKKSPGAKGA